MSRWRRQQIKRARRARYKLAELEKANALAEARKYAPVLERMLAILRGRKDLPFGVALSQAQKDTGLQIPKYLEGPMLLTAFKLVTSGRLASATSN